MLALALPAVVGHWGPPFIGFGFLWLLVPLFWFVVLFLVFGVFGRRWRRRAFTGQGPWGDRGTRSAEATLAARYANGDIDEKEYRARLEVLRSMRVE